MRKSILAFLFVLMACPAIWAQEDQSGLKEGNQPLVEAMTDTGNHGIVTADSSQASSASSKTTISETKITETSVKAPQAADTMPAAPAVQPTATPTTITATADTSPNADINQQLAAEDQAIKQLNEAIARLHTGTETSSHE